MKSIFKLFPAALAVVAFASCSNDNLFSGSTEAPQFTNTLEVIHEGISDGAGTRAYMTEDGNNVKYVSTDVIRVYDESITVYDKYTFSGSAFGTNGTKVDAAKAKYAIFPSEQVKWGDNDADAKVAVTINDEVDLSSVINGKDFSGAKAYVANIPAWGEVKAGSTKDKLEVTLYDMTAILKIQLNKVPGNANGNWIKVYSDATVTAPNDPSPIVGMFSATLDKDIATNKSNTATKLTFDPSFTTGSEMWVYLGKEAIEQAYVYLPMVAGTYLNNEIKVAQYRGGTAPGNKFAEELAFDANDGANRTFVRGKVYKKSFSLAEATTLTEEDPLQITNILKANKNKGADVTVTVTGAITTNNNAEASNHTIVIPTDLKNNITVVLNNDVTCSDKPLTISGGTAGKTVTFVFNGTNGLKGGDVATDLTSAANYKGLVINSASNVVLEGAINTSVGVLSTNTGAVTFNGAWTKAINRNLVFKAGDLTIGAAATGLVDGINYEGTGALSILANIANADVYAKTASSLNIEANIIDTDASGDDGIVETGAATNTITGNITRVNPCNGATTFTLEDAVINILGADDAANHLYKAETTINVASSGNSWIGTVTNPVNATFAFTSTWDLTTAASTVSAPIVANKIQQIYTAAQLTKIVGGTAAITGVKLNADITISNLTGVKAFASPDLASLDFDGGKHTITGLTAPLFGTVTATAATGNTIKDLTLKNVSISNEDNVGALAVSLVGATTAAKYLTVSNVEVNTGTIGVAAGTSAHQNMLGGLAGTASNNIIFKSCLVKGVAIKGFAAMGGFIGYLDASAADADIQIQGVKNSTKSSVTFANNFTASNYNALQKAMFGRVGNFIGTANVATGIAANVTVGTVTPATPNALSSYFTNNVDKTALKFNIHDDGGYPAKYFVGMDGNYVGFSTVAGTGTLTIHYAGQAATTQQGGGKSEINIFK